MKWVHTILNDTVQQVMDAIQVLDVIQVIYKCYTKVIYVIYHQLLFLLTTNIYSGGAYVMGSDSMVDLICTFLWIYWPCFPLP